MSDSKTAIKPWEIETGILTMTVGLVNFGLYFAYLGALFSTLMLFLAANEFAVLGYGPQASSGVLMAITVIAAAEFMFGGGVLSDRLGMQMPILLGFLAVSFVGFLLLTVADSVVGLVAACVLMSRARAAPADR